MNKRKLLEERQNKTSKAQRILEADPAELEKELKRFLLQMTTHYNSAKHYGNKIIGD